MRDINTLTIIERHYLIYWKILFGQENLLRKMVCYFFDHLGVILDKLMQIEDGKEEVIEELKSRLFVVLDCIDGFLYTLDTSATSFVKSKKHMDYLFESFYFVQDEEDVTLLIFDIIRVFCSQDNTANLVMLSLRIFLISEDDVFVEFVEQLLQGDSLTFKTEFLKFLTVLVVTDEFSEEIVDLFVERGVTYTALQKLKTAFPSDEIVENVNTFIDEAGIDATSTGDLRQKVELLQVTLEKNMEKYKELESKYNKALEDLAKKPVIVEVKKEEEKKRREERREERRKTYFGYV